MEKQVKKQGYILIFIARDRFDLYESVNGNIFSFPFAPTVVNALDVVNPSELQNQIKIFIEQNQINPADILILVSAGALFEKDIYTKDMTGEQIETATKTFLSTVPFDIIASKIINFNGGQRVSAVNKNLCEGIVYAFEKLGSSLNGIVPYEALGPEMAEISSLDANTAAAIVRKFDSLKSQSFPVEEKKKKIQETTGATNPGNETVPTGEKKEPVDKKRILILGIVFASLVAVLMYLLLNPPS